ncbi:hypothetical protein SZ64_09080 [Erythrobacter sp. SG61-1L]|uniref:flagellar hook-basal body complex protein FliE n=1 Tax=Erythrobacter sp. SG61-1L TaxID=1603897 RepID=UPI0006C90A49|nr:flagellar hook-basal body complex protein FliE [Erythrobacter sp. SG61-1L]KPL68260.1 hypothetical protein SZ64_09080 [Erythrobacter sp. SG61-1L]
MSALDPIAALGLSDAAPQIMRVGLPAMPSVDTPGASFQSVLSAGLDTVNQKVAHADELVRQFALDDSVPVHQVTIALEEARLSVELAMQVRTRLVETYRELMNMQL